MILYFEEANGDIVMVHAKGAKEGAKPAELLASCRGSLKVVGGNANHGQLGNSNKTTMV